MASSAISTPTLPKLLSQLEHPDQSVRLHVAPALGLMGPKAKKAVPALTKVLKHHDVQVRKMAALGVGDIGPHARSAVSALVEALR